MSRSFKIVLELTYFHELGCVIVADDVSIGRTKLGLVGRRGLAGFIITIKILGAAAESGLQFSKMLELGNAVVKNLVSIGAGLDHCHRPGGSSEFGALPDDTIEIGLGIHNEAVSFPFLAIVLWLIRVLGIRQSLTCTITRSPHYDNVELSTRSK